MFLKLVTVTELLYNHHDNGKNVLLPADIFDLSFANHFIRLKKYHIELFIYVLLHFVIFKLGI